MLFYREMYPVEWIILPDFKQFVIQIVNLTEEMF